jgi:hypothetical protein
VPAAALRPLVAPSISRTTRCAVDTETIESTRQPSSDTTEIVALMRWGLGYRDTEAAAISYNLTMA